MKSVTANKSSEIDKTSQAQTCKITKKDLENIYADFKSSELCKRSNKLGKSDLKILENIWQIQNQKADIKKQKIFLEKTIGINIKNLKFSRKLTKFMFDLQLTALLDRRRAFCYKYSSGRDRFSINPKFINTLNLLYSAL